MIVKRFFFLTLSIYYYIIAQYDVIIIESVGLGQSEIEIDKAVDMLLLLIPPTGGDSLQASKKGMICRYYIRLLLICTRFSSSETLLLLLPS